MTSIDETLVRFKLNPNKFSVEEKTALLLFKRDENQLIDNLAFFMESKVLAKVGINNLHKDDTVEECINAMGWEDEFSSVLAKPFLSSIAQGTWSMWGHQEPKQWAHDWLNSTQQHLCHIDENVKAFGRGY